MLSNIVDILSMSLSHNGTFLGSTCNPMEVVFSPVILFVSNPS
nr:MAG TPA: hypothetical protein [Bacteriophage sp.]